MGHGVTVENINKSLSSLLLYKAEMVKPEKLYYTEFIDGIV